MITYWTGILGGLIGSVFTVVITKLLDILQKGKEHKYSLQKMFFEKKLLAAEATITQNTMLSIALLNLSILYERINNDPTDIENYISENLGAQVDHQLKVANDASFIVASSITLYFDLDIKFNKNKATRDFYNLMGRMGPLTEARDIALENYEKMIGTQNEKMALEHFHNATKELNNMMNSISKAYTKFDTLLNDIILQIRDDMRKFDY
jgi:hypothetical protein